MGKIEAIFLDLDGTTLTSEHTVSENLKNKLDELEKKGVKIFIATGRTFTSASPFVEMLKIKNPVITYNGGRIVDPATKEMIYEKPLDAQTVEKIIKIAREKNIHLNLYKDDKLYIEKETEEGKAYAKNVGIPYYVENFDNFFGKTSTKALFINENEVLQKLNKEVNKGLTVKVMLEKYNISPQNTMAFGDQWNDLEMLKFVKYGYLMGNATEELKKEFSSDRITLSNDEDGIYEVLKNL